MSLHSFSDPIVTNKASLLRDMKTNSKDFRDIVTELNILPAYEATKYLEISKDFVTGWVGRSVEGENYPEKDPSIIPVFWAGTGMQEKIYGVISCCRDQLYRIKF